MLSLGPPGYMTPTIPRCSRAIKIRPRAYGENTDFYCNPALDALYKQELATVDVGARQDIFTTDPTDLSGRTPFHRALQHARDRNGA